jgi:dTDP-glucose 4,6-dehydratase
MQTILVTGGAGFIGSNFIPYFLAKYPHYRIVNLDLLTYAGNPENLKEIEGNPRYIFVKGDIANRELVEHIFSHYRIEGVIHFAAESHVDNSISSPEAFIKTNVNGTFNLIDVARKFWTDAPFQYKPEFERSKFLHVSTDEVYGTLGETGFFTETTPYAPNSPYSASKAASDMIVRSYFHTYGLKTVTTNCSNNYGPKQHDEKLIPVIIRKAVSRQPIPIYGDGKNVRDWLFVLDHCAAIDAAYHAGRFGETYNIGARNEQNNINIANLICTLLDDMHPLNDGTSYKKFISFVKDRPGHDRRYAIDPQKIENELKWQPSVNFEQGLRMTIEWYLRKYLSKKSENPQPKIERQEKTEEPAGAKRAQCESSGNYSFHTSSTGFDPNAYKTVTPDFEIGNFEPNLNEITAQDLNKALEGLAEIKAAVNILRKNIAELQDAHAQRDKKATQIIQAAQSGLLEWAEANKYAMSLLNEQNQIQKLMNERKKEIGKLLILEEKMTNNVAKIREALRTKKIEPKIPDSSETISMIERMKHKIHKNEILSDLYEKEAQKKEFDAELEKKVNEALGTDPQKIALDELKRKLNMR